MEQQKEKELSWNLAQFLIMEVAELLKKASDYFISRDWKNNLYCLIAIRQRIPSSDNEKIKELKGMEESLKLQSTITGVSGFNKNTKSKIDFQKLFIKNVGIYNDKLMEVLKEVGLYIPLKKDKTKI